MLSSKVTVSAPSGLHARPAGELVKIVKSFSDTEVKICSGVRCVNASSMLSILSLGIKNGTELEVSASGPSEAGALEAVCAFLSAVSD